MSGSTIAIFVVVNACWLAYVSTAVFGLLTSKPSFTEEMDALTKVIAANVGAAVFNIAIAALLV